MVVSYNSFHCMNTKAKVAIDGIYEKKEEALARQIEISGGNVENMYPNKECKFGSNGVISWIKLFQVGDLERFDINTIT